MVSQACLAATRVAAFYGHAVHDPVVIQDTNNTVVWLRPHAIIAKVGKWAHSEEALRHEHAVATALIDFGAPIAPPIPGTEPRRDEETGFLVTLWQRLEHDRDREVAAADVVTSMRRLHDGLGRFRGRLPSFRSGLQLARSALRSERMRALPPDDRAMLEATFDHLLREVELKTFTEQGLHGEPHRGNLLATPAGPRWIDLEAACRGPLEWDLAFLPDEAVVAFAEADLELLRLLRTLNSARVASWCWLRADVREMRRHGEHHLEVVRLAAKSF